MDEKEILESTYWDTCDVFRNTETETEDGETVFQEQQVHSGLPCALSKASNGYNANQDVPNEIKYASVLFLSPNYLILAGDKIIITQENGIQRTFKAGEAFVYSSHQEIPLLREDEA